MEKIKLSQAVLVEGRYDKIKLDSFIDGLILPVHGFSIFTDMELRELIKQLAQERGVIVLMDSDAAGFKIRGFLNGMLPKGQITHVYIPDVKGKEKRKRIGSKEGTLGVEGIDIPTLKEAFTKAGVLGEEVIPEKQLITKTDLFTYGFSGGADSSKKRKVLYEKLGLPQKMSVNGVLPILNKMLTYEEFIQLAEEIQR